MRRLILRLIHHAGLWRLWHALHRRSMLILTVHGVMHNVPGQPWHPLRSRLSPARLDECLAILTRHYRFVPLADAIEMLAGRRPLVPNAAVLTFDDGYRNHLTEALPVLQRHRVPATVFVSTGPVESRQPFWFDRLDYALQQSVTSVRELSLFGGSVRLDGSSRQALTASYAALRACLKDPERDDREMNREIDAIATALEGDSGHALASIADSDPWSAPVTVDEIRAAADIVDFGSHTVDHLRIHRLPSDVAADQVRRSKASLEAWTGRPCRTFCYPDGGVSAEAAQVVRASGYAAAVTTERGLNRPGADLMWLRRMDLPEKGDRYSLLASVSGLTDWLLRSRA